MLTLQEDQILTIPNLMPAALPLWVALVVRSRHEKSVQTILDAKGYRTSVPLVRCFHKRSSGSVWDSQKPLIAGYVFAVQDRENPFRIVTTPGFVEIVSFGSEPGIILEAEIEALERIAASGLPVASCGYTRIGETVELIAGPLQGVRGIVLRQGTRSSPNWWCWAACCGWAFCSRSPWPISPRAAGWEHSGRARPEAMIGFVSGHGISPVGAPESSPARERWEPEANPVSPVGAKGYSPASNRSPDTDRKSVG